MKPQSLAAKLLAATPQGRRLFELLSNLHQDVERLQAELEQARILPRMHAEFEQKAIQAEQRKAIAEQLLSVQELETANARAELDRARATIASMAEATHALTRSLPYLGDVVRERLDLLSANIAGLAARQDSHFQSLRLADQRGGGDAAGLYLDLIEKALTGTLHGDASAAPWAPGELNPARRAIGRDWPSQAETMIGVARMRNLRLLLETALANGVEGDFIETGVWRGGACIYARAILAAHGDRTRRVFVADSFRGLPRPDEEAFPEDRGDTHAEFQELAISQQQVAANFSRYGLLDDRVVFLEGWFKDTLPTAPIEKLAVLRLDGDMYESTIQALEALYPKVSPGGFVIIDDYLLGPCAKAVHDYRDRFGISAPLTDVDGAAVWWQVPA